MASNITKAVRIPCKNRFEEMLDDGAFPEVNWQRTARSRFYNMFEYSETWARFMRIVGRAITEEWNDPAGVWTLKRSKKFVEWLEAFLRTITEEQVNAVTDRYRTVWD